MHVHHGGEAEQLERLEQTIDVAEARAPGGCWDTLWENAVGDVLGRQRHKQRIRNCGVALAAVIADLSRTIRLRPALEQRHPRNSVFCVSAVPLCSSVGYQLIVIALSCISA